MQAEISMTSFVVFEMIMIILLTNNTVLKKTKSASAIPHTSKYRLITQKLLFFAVIVRERKAKRCNNVSCEVKCFFNLYIYY